MDFTNSVWPWIFGVTIYGLGKTFYWPTLLGVISERFPRGGALALGISGGIGMLSAGLLGGPGIGYKQDYFIVQKLEETSPETYKRYKAVKPNGEPDEQGFPIVTKVDPSLAPKIAGIDNAKYAVFKEYAGYLDAVAAAEKSQARGQDRRHGAAKIRDKRLTLTLPRLKRKRMPANLLNRSSKSNSPGLHQWWIGEGKPNFETDKQYLIPARDFGGKTALTYTAAVPAALAVAFLLLLLYFAGTGGYSQVRINEPHGGMGKQATPK